MLVYTYFLQSTSSSSLITGNRPVILFSNLLFLILPFYTLESPSSLLPLLVLGELVKMAAPGMPLNCSICPKKPKFSDISHLLTHVGSKGHLSNYYRTKIQAASDAVLAAIINTYDQWYTDWGIDELMHERINHKDKKKPRPPKTTGKQLI